MKPAQRGDPPSLRVWQKAAMHEWRAHGQRGIVAAATGTGKTRVALAALQSLTQGWRTVVVVPTKALQRQWVSAIAQALQIHPKNVGTIGGEEPHFSVNHGIVVAVLNSATERIPGIVEYWAANGLRVLLIVDECHWAGTERAATSLFSVDYDSTLGLSATPERGDDGLDDYLVPNLGEVVYRYPVRQALDDKLLSELVVANLYLDLSAMETAEYQTLGVRIHQAMNTGADETDPRIRRLRDKQRAVLRKSGGRLVAIQSLIEGGLLKERRTILFHETIEQAWATAALLDDHEIPHALEHSRLRGDARKAALRRFSSGSSPVLVSVRALDEGIDVPQANTAVIVSGTMNPRQRVQRVGRVLRPSGGAALVVTLLARGTTEETIVGDRDAELFGADRVVHLRRWTSAHPGPTVEFLRGLVEDLNERVPRTGSNVQP